MKVRNICLLLLCCIWSNLSFAQHYFYNNQYYDRDFLFEGGVSLGTMNCLTDIGGKPGAGKVFLKDLNWQNTKMSGSVFANLSYRYALSFRLELNAGKIMAYDSILKNDPSEGRYRYRRNLHFKSNISELMLVTELHPLVMLRPGKKVPALSPYMAGGIGVFHFNPQAELNGAWVALRDLHTEGQGFTEYPERKEYALTQLNFPVGAGIRFECSAMMNLRFEILHRIILTDYLDDVSTRYIDPTLFQKYLTPDFASNALQLYNRQNEIDPLALAVTNEIRGNSNKNDSYFTIQLKLSVVLGREKR